MCVVQQTLMAEHFTQASFNMGPPPAQPLTQQEAHPSWLGTFHDGGCWPVPRDRTLLQLVGSVAGSMLELNSRRLLKISACMHVMKGVPSLLLRLATTCIYMRAGALPPVPHIMMGAMGQAANGHPHACLDESINYDYQQGPVCKAESAR